MGLLAFSTVLGWGDLVVRCVTRCWGTERMCFTLSCAAASHPTKDRWDTASRRGSRRKDSGRRNFPGSGGFRPAELGFLRPCSAPHKVLGECHRRHRTVEFRQFLDTVEAAMPAGLDAHLILDKYGTHKTAVVQRWLLRQTLCTRTDTRIGQVQLRSLC